MTELFLCVLNLSYSAVWIVATVILLRLLLRKAPKWIHVLLWSLVAVRLLLPVSIESSFSLQPSAQVISPTAVTDPIVPVHTGLAAVNVAVNEQIVNGSDNDVFIIQSRIPFLTAIWGIGMTAMAVYAAASVFLLRRKLREKQEIAPDQYVCGSISTPFVLGVFRPKIFLPRSVDGADLAHVIAHEQAHIHRKDHWWKPLGFLLLSVHWFNPALWLAYVLLCRDIELACDEKVIKALGEIQRADYSQTILNCGVSRRRIAACPLAFGEVGVKTRIRHVLHYKKPGFWILLIAVLALIITAVCLLTVPEENGKIVLDGYAFQQLDYQEELPRGSREIGRIMDTPDALLQPLDLPDRYLGLPVYRHDGEPRKLYIPTSKGFLCFYSPDWRLESQGTQLWVDGLENPGNMEESEICLPEFPGVTFRYTSGAVAAVQNGETAELFVGMPIWNVFFSDLNGDGYSEICATVSFGSGMIDNHVVVMDYHGGQLYTLWDRGEYDYTLRMTGGVLLCEKRQYPHGELVKSGPLTMTANSFVPWSLTIADTAMEPTEANLKGIFDCFLFLEGKDGRTYRYERADVYGETLTKGVLLDTFTEFAEPQDVQWEVYTIEEIPDGTSVLAIADGAYPFRYNYSPSKGIGRDLLQQVKEEGYAVMEDGEPTHGQAYWQAFYEATLRGEPASVEIARWYTLDPSTCDTAYYEAFKEDYPCIYYDEIRFDGSVYQVIKREDNRLYIPTYEYLMRYETEVPTQRSRDVPQKVIRYVLTHDKTHTWEELFYSLVSSAMGAVIDHYTVYTER